MWYRTVNEIAPLPSPAIFRVYVWAAHSDLHTTYFKQILIVITAKIR